MGLAGAAHDLNQFMARLNLLLFRRGHRHLQRHNLFTSTIERMSTTEAGSVEHVLTELFRAMTLHRRSGPAPNSAHGPTRSHG